MHLTATINGMKLPAHSVCVFVLTACLAAQSAAKPVTIPITLDHNRIIVDVYLPLPDGTTKRVRAWVNSGDPDMMVSQRVALLFGSVSCNGQLCTATPPPELVIGGMKISLSAIRSANAPVGDPPDVMIPGMAPEISIPSIVLRNYDVVLDYASRQLTIGEPGTVKFTGKPIQARIDPVGTIQIVGKIEGTLYNFGIDTGASISFVSSGLLSQWRKLQPSWPFMTGALGVANVLGNPDEPSRQVVRVPLLQCGTATLTGVLFAGFSDFMLKSFQEKAGAQTPGVLGGDAFRNYRVGIDYAHGVVYLDRVTNSTAASLDVVGLTLRPERDGRYTVIAVVDFNGKPSVPDVQVGDVLLGVDGAPATGATMGQVWSLLGGAPGEVRSLTVERDGKRFTVDATVRPFLVPEPREKANR
jgi:hypothetical protein